MAKCIKYSDGTVHRTTDEVAHSLVRAGKATYCAKHVWKNQNQKREKSK